MGTRQAPGLAAIVLGCGLARLVGFACGGGAGEEGGGAGEEGGGEGDERFQPEQTIPGIESELVAIAADGVMAMDFAPDGRLFFTEINSGNIRIVTPTGQLLDEPFAQVDLGTAREATLTGLAIDPNFEENSYVYVYFSKAAEIEPFLGSPALMRFTDTNSRGTDPIVLMEFPLADPEIPVSLGGRIHFGPDGYLYISVGDIRDARFDQLAQDLSSPFLRVTRDGDPAPDNPFVDEPGADPRIYAYGLRDTGDFAFEGETGRLYAPDAGDVNCDELNIIEAGENYGWPGGVPCSNPGGVEPIYHYALPGKAPEEVVSDVDPTGIEFVSGDVYPALGDGLLVCEFKTGFMRRLQLSGPNQNQVSDDAVAVQDCTVALASDDSGVIYYSNAKEIRRLPPQ